MPVCVLCVCASLYLSFLLNVCLCVYVCAASNKAKIVEQGGVDVLRQLSMSTNQKISSQVLPPILLYPCRLQKGMYMSMYT